MAEENRNIAIIAPNLLNGFSAGLIWAIQSESFNTKYDTVIYAARAANSKGGPDYLYAKIAAEKKVGAIIVIAHTVEEKFISGFLSAGITPVLIDTRMKGVSSVTADNEKGAYEAGKYLAKTGRKKIGIVAGIASKVDSQRERLAGFTQGMTENGAKVDPTMIWTIKDYTHQSGKDAFRFMLMNDVDTVFCAAGDFVAYGVLNEARKQGVAVPHDMAIVGFDDVPLSADLELTTVKQPLEDMGKEAFKMAVEQIENPKLRPRSKVFECSLTIRNTA